MLTAVAKIVFGAALLMPCATTPNLPRGAVD